MNSIKQIKQDLEAVLQAEQANAYTGAGIDAFLEKYEKDSRTGVQQLRQKAEKYKRDLAAERARLKIMSVYEDEYAGLTIAGVDEVGRGPLAGPVVAGIVILDPARDFVFKRLQKVIR